jgi:glycosyltransferase involved in cell wall biosynthesis
VRVLQVASYYWPATEFGGPVQSVAALAEALREAGCDVEVLTTNARGPGAGERVAAGSRLVRGVPVTYCEAVGPLRYFCAPGLVGSLLRRLRGTDVVHLHGIFTFPTAVGARLARLYGVPYMVAPRGSLDPWALGQKSLKKAIYMAAIEESTLRGAAAVHYTAVREALGVPKELRDLPHVVVPNCLNVQSLAGVDDPVARRDSFEVVALGRIHQMKGFDTLLPAMAKVVAREPRAFLTVAGPDDGGYRRVVERLAVALGIGSAVRFVGTVDEVGRATLLGRCALVALPSYRENFGMAVAEAMAAGLPVVVSDGVALADDIEEFRAGLVVAREPDAIASALLLLLGDAARRQEMGERGRKLVRERFSRRAVGAAMLDAYRGMLAGRPTSDA